MAEQNRTELKTYFETGKRPTQQQFAHLIDSVINKLDDEISVGTDNNIGIGTSSPSRRLEIVTQDSWNMPPFRIGSENSNEPAVDFKSGTDIFAIAVNNGGTDAFKIHHLATENSLVVDDGGNVGIGTTTPTELLEVNGNVKTDQLIADSLHSLAMTWQHPQKILPSDVQGSHFGYSVALSGDWALVGAYYEGVGGSAPGSAYLYQLEDGRWVEKQMLQAFNPPGVSDAEAGDQFGISVALNGDWALVGACLEDPNGISDAGSAYLYQLENGQWMERQKLGAFDPLGISDAVAGDQFGRSVALSGDWALIGAYSGNADGVADTGSAYLYQLENGQWVEKQKLRAFDPPGVSNAEAGGRFGFSVALSGDWALVGAQREDTDGVVDAGSAYLYQLEDGQWVERQKLRAFDPPGISDTGAEDYFGSSVALNGDWALVGAYAEDPDGITDAGSAYLYQLEDGQWVEKQKLQAPNAQAEEVFGLSVALSGDWVLVGAYTGGDNVGGAYLYQLEDGQWVYKQKLRATDAQAQDLFGISVALSGDWVLVGAHLEDTGGDNVGSAYLYPYRSLVKTTGSLEVEGALVIRESDNAGIGTTNPVDNLYIDQAWDSGITINSLPGTRPILRFQHDGIINGQISVNGSDDLRLSGGGFFGADHVVIKNDGKVGIGTANPNPGSGLHMWEDRYTLYGPNSPYGAYLQVGGYAHHTTAAAIFATDGNLHLDCQSVGHATHINYYSQGNTIINANAGNVGIGGGPSEKLTVHGNANKTLPGDWGGISDRRVKKKIKPFEDSLEFLKQVMPIWYKYNGKAGIKNSDENVGVIAQDIQKIFPYMVSSYKAKLNKSDKEDSDILTFNGSALRFVIINAIKELDGTVRQIDKRLARLESQLAK